MNRHRNPIAALRRLHPWLALATALAVLPAWSLRAQSGGGYDLTWNRAGGGPAAPAAGGGYDLQSVAGQPAAGQQDDGGSELALENGYGAIYAIHAFTLRLSLGWNVVSVPLQPLDPAWRQVLPEAARGPLWAWSAAGYEPVRTVVPKCGYWVWSEASAERVVQGVAVDDPYLDLPAGWHLVGPVGLPPYPDLALPLAATPAAAVFGSPRQWQPDLGITWPTDAGLAAGLGSWIGLQEPARLRLGP